MAALQAFLHGPGASHGRHLEVLRQVLFAGAGGAAPAPGPEPEPEPAPEVTEDFLTFRDWNGTIVASYTREEALLLEALPDVPDHAADEELVDGEWNWTLTEIQTAAASWPFITVGAVYDGALVGEAVRVTQLDIVPDEVRTLKFANPGRYSYSIDWGDGTVETTSDGSVTHTYTDTKPRTVRISGSSNRWNLELDYSCDRMIRRVKGGWTRLTTRTADVDLPKWFGRWLEAVSLPKSCTTTKSPHLGYAYGYGCPNLKFIAMPRIASEDNLPNIQNVGWNVPGGVVIAWPGNLGTPSSSGTHQPVECLLHEWGNTELVSRFYNRLAAGGRTAISSSVTAPTSAPNLECLVVGNAAPIPERTQMKSVKIPAGFQTLYAESQVRLGGLDVEIPSTVTFINCDAAVGSDSGHLIHAGSLHIKATTPPTLWYADTNGVTARIYVPAASVAAYKSATNWSRYANYIFPEPEPEG